MFGEWNANEIQGVEGEEVQVAGLARKSTQISTSDQSRWFLTWPDTFLCLRSAGARREIWIESFCSCIRIATVQIPTLHIYLANAVLIFLLILPSILSFGFLCLFGVISHLTISKRRVYVGLVKFVDGSNGSDVYSSGTGYLRASTL